VCCHTAATCCNQLGSKVCRFASNWKDGGGANLRDVLFGEANLRVTNLQGVESPGWWISAVRTPSRSRCRNPPSLSGAEYRWKVASGPVFGSVHCDVQEFYTHAVWCAVAKFCTVSYFGEGSVFWGSAAAPFHRGSGASKDSRSPLRSASSYRDMACKLEHYFCWHGPCTVLTVAIVIHQTICTQLCVYTKCTHIYQTCICNVHAWSRTDNRNVYSCEKMTTVAALYVHSFVHWRFAPKVNAAKSRPCSHKRVKSNSVFRLITIIPLSL